MKVINQLSMLMVCGFCMVTGEILVYLQHTHRLVDVTFSDMPSTFGSPISPDGLRAFVVYADPPNACTPLTPPPQIVNYTGYWAVLIRRYDCTFEKKIREAQAANYDIAIVHNVNSSELERMQASDPEGIVIPSVFIGEKSGLHIKENFLFNKGYYILIEDDSPFDIGTHLLLPFAIVVALCFCSMIGFMIIKCIKDHRRNRRHRLPNSSLKKIPIHKFKKGDPYETCAICLEDFVDGEKLRLLPCSHAYHSKCIDPWLTRNKRVCPMCKRRVFAEDERVPSDSESGSDDDDRRPLLQNVRGANQGGGTFNDEAVRRIERMLRMGNRSFRVYVRTEDNGTSTQGGAGPSQNSGGRGNVSEDSDSFHSDHSSNSNFNQLTQDYLDGLFTNTNDIMDASYAIHDTSHDPVDASYAIHDTSHNPVDASFATHDSGPPSPGSYSIQANEDVSHHDDHYHDDHHHDYC